MKCIQCGHEQEKTQGIYRYNESGLDNITLVNIPIYECPSCKEKDVEIPCLEELHQLIAFLIIFSPVRLKGKEVKYLRKHLGYTADDFAQSLGVTRVTVTRWETSKTSIPLDNDKAIRRFYLSKRGSELEKFPEPVKALSILVDKLPLPRPKRELRIHPEDWAACAQS